MLDELDIGPNFDLATFFGVGPLRYPVVDHDEGQVWILGVRTEHGVHEHEVRSIGAVLSLAAREDGGGKDALHDPENWVRDEAGTELLVDRAGAASDHAPEGLPIPILTETEGVSCGSAVETEPLAEGGDRDAVGLVAQAEFDEGGIVTVPLELEGGEEFLCVHLVGGVAEVPKGCANPNPGSEKFKIFFYPKIVEGGKVHHGGVLEDFGLQGEEVVVHPTGGHVKVACREAGGAVGVLSRAGLLIAGVIWLRLGMGWWW